MGNPKPGADKFKPPVPNILVADDDPSILDTLSLMLANMGMCYYLARNGKEAVEIYHTHRDSIDLVISDVEMPELNGIQVAHWIRSINPSAKLVLISGHSTRDVWIARPDAFVPKPFMHIDLKNVVERLLGNESSLESEQQWRRAEA